MPLGAASVVCYRCAADGDDPASIAQMRHADLNRPEHPSDIDGECIAAMAFAISCALSSRDA